MTPEPVAAPPSSGPVVGVGGRSVAAIRVDAELASFVVVNGRPEAVDAWHRVARDVPSLLAEVEAAHRFEEQAGVEREALLAEVEAVAKALRSMQFSKYRNQDDWAWLNANGLAARLDRALAAAADAPQPEPVPWRCRRCSSDRWVAASLHGPDGPAIRQCVRCGHYSNDPVPGPSPAVLPEREQQR